MRVEHPFVPGIYPTTRMILEVRECATLGTNFADVYMNDVLFARELPKPVAEKFVQYPQMYPTAFCDLAKMRAFVVEARERSDD